MPHVDPADDAVQRFVVQHYRFDPNRNERRNVTVTAYDNEAEFLAHLEAERAALEAGKRAGNTDPREHLLGVVLEPEDRAEPKRPSAPR